jgi:alkaline phosphatase D
MSCRTADAQNEGTARIAFGSCLKAQTEQPVWDTMRALDPDLFVFLGDNVYADTRDADQMRATYALLGNRPEYIRFKKEVPILATWDDHDYGENDAGAEYPLKQESKKIFLEFFNEPHDSTRHSHPGIYHDRRLELAGLDVQILLLDTRTFRGPLTKRDPSTGGGGPYMATDDATTTLLGNEQWRWLEKRLLEPADLRIIASSIQVLAEEHHWEKWMNFPHERERLLRVIRDTGAEGVIFLSGDRHHSEISSMDPGWGIPLYDITSSGMNCGMPDKSVEPNRHRVLEMYRKDSFGTITIERRGRIATLTIGLHDIDGTRVREEIVPLSRLRRSSRGTALNGAINDE